MVLYTKHIYIYTKGHQSDKGLQWHFDAIRWCAGHSLLLLLLLTVIILNIHFPLPTNKNNIRWTWSDMRRNKCCCCWAPCAFRIFRCTATFCCYYYAYTLHYTSYSNEFHMHNWTVAAAPVQSVRWRFVHFGRKYIYKKKHHAARIPHVNGCCCCTLTPTRPTRCACVTPHPWWPPFGQIKGV